MFLNVDRGGVVLLPERHQLGDLCGVVRGHVALGFDVTVDLCKAFDGERFVVAHNLLWIDSVSTQIGCDRKTCF